MGFLGLYNGTTKVQINAPDDGDWWVEVRDVLPKADYDAAQKALITNQQVVNDQYTAKPDTVAYQTELVARAIVNWNLTDENDTGLPVATLEQKRASLARLPQSVWLPIYVKVNDLNTPREAKDADSFRAGSAGSTPTGAVA